MCCACDVPDIYRPVVIFISFSMPDRLPAASVIRTIYMPAGSVLISTFRIASCRSIVFPSGAVMMIFTGAGASIYSMV